MYQPYPTSGQQPAQAPQAEPPQTVRRAASLMYAGAALSLLVIVINLFLIGSLKDAIRSQEPNLSASQVHSVEIATIVFAVVTGLIGAGLWILMARMNLAGRSWARIVATVLFAINTIGLLTTIVRPNSVAVLILDVVLWLVGLGAIWLLWQRDSSAYFQARSNRIR
jgi:hypothetical protein